MPEKRDEIDGSNSNSVRSLRIVSSPNQRLWEKLCDHMTIILQSISWNLCISPPESVSAIILFRISVTKCYDIADFHKIPDLMTNLIITCIYISAKAHDCDCNLRDIVNAVEFFRHKLRGEELVLMSMDQFWIRRKNILEIEAKVLPLVGYIIPRIELYELAIEYVVLIGCCNFVANLTICLINDFYCTPCFSRTTSRQLIVSALLMAFRIKILLLSMNIEEVQKSLRLPNSALAYGLQWNRRMRKNLLHREDIDKKTLDSMKCPCEGIGRRLMITFSCLLLNDWKLSVKSEDGTVGAENQGFGGFQHSGPSDDILLRDDDARSIEEACRDLTFFYRRINRY